MTGLDRLDNVSLIGTVTLTLIEVALWLLVPITS
jgi:hypothetical protein